MSGYVVEWLRSRMLCGQRDILDLIPDAEHSTIFMKETLYSFTHLLNYSITHLLNYSFTQ